MPLRLTRFVLFLLAVCACSTLGCSGKKTATVKGTVKYKNELLKSGTVKFFGANDATSSCTILGDGTFTCEGVPMGEVRVTVEQITGGLPGGLKDAGKSGLFIPGQDKKSTGGGPPPKLAVPEGASTIGSSANLPATLKNPDTSGLKYTIDVQIKDIEIIIP
ncbi:hypothetical protein J8F10_15280 [Gemmata sp. G18]|uniref:DUF4369 domain-containing protein n=1 Tax=Gemmata palustris TaxID=2822762 RepID=A0ABS5BSD4_9BACT|nr:hypothetical protein [Gemmata palustris]MBP3956635.1 hypothetical protein [Gemmata palustris]